MYVCTKVGEASWTVLYSGAKAYIRIIRTYVQYAESAHTYVHTYMHV